eukprot:14222779-Alexandrium_andersonii.AAC.1
MFIVPPLPVRVAEVDNAPARHQVRPDDRERGEAREDAAVVARRASSIFTLPPLPADDEEVATQLRQ